MRFAYAVIAILLFAGIIAAGPGASAAPADEAPAAAAPGAAAAEGRIVVAQQWSPFDGLFRLFGGQDRSQQRPYEPQRTYEPQRAYEPQRIAPRREDAPRRDYRARREEETPVRIRPTRPKGERVIRLENDEGKPADAPKAANPQAILVIGDSLAGGLAQGLDAIYGRRADVAIVNKTRPSSGIVRDDYYDWNAALPQILAETKPTAIVVMIGGNDRQSLYSAGGRLVERLASPGWLAAYVERVKRLVAQLQASGKPFYWVSLPPAANSEYSAFLVSLNDIQKPIVIQGGGAWIDVWAGFTDEDGRFTPGGPDVDGELRRLRTSDGVHFTKAGQRKLAWYVDLELAKALKGAPPPPVGAVGEPAEPGPAEPAPAAPPVAAAPAPPKAPEAPGAGPEPLARLGNLPPSPSAPAAPAPLWRRPGPVIPLTEPSPGGANDLAGAEPARPRPLAATPGDPARQRLIDGEALDPPAGRADDFRWPGQQP